MNDPFEKRLNDLIPRYQHLADIAETPTSKYASETCRDLVKILLMHYKNERVMPLKDAYQAGVASVHKNKEIDDLLEQGTKQCPARPSFENWLEVQTMFDLKG